MSRLEEIKNEYAIKRNYSNFNTMYLSSSFNELNHYIGVIMQLYAEECVKASLEKASENSEVLVEGIVTIESKKIFTLYDKGVKGIVEREVSPNKKSITNENNIILL